MTEDERIERLLRASRADRFAPGFADRVMHRMAARQATLLGPALQHTFKWLMPAAVAAILLLGFFNVRNAGDSRTTLERALGLPQVTLAAAYSFDAGQNGTGH